MNKLYLIGLLLLGLLCFSACPKSEDAGGGTPTPTGAPDGGGEETATEEGGE